MVPDSMRLMRPLPLTHKELALASVLLLFNGVNLKAKLEMLLLESCPQRSTRMGFVRLVLSVLVNWTLIRVEGANS